jgi:hypothetical protein
VDLVVNDHQFGHIPKLKIKHLLINTDMVKKMGNQKKETWHLLYSYSALLQAHRLCTVLDLTYLLTITWAKKAVLVQLELTDKNFKNTNPILKPSNHNVYRQTL